MTLDPQAASVFLETLKEHAALVPNERRTSPLPGRRKLGCVFAPDLSYGRLHEPVHGNEEFQWVWSLWTRTACIEDMRGGVVRLGQNGWRGLHGGEREALALLQGVELPDPLALGRELARRFTR